MRHAAETMENYLHHEGKKRTAEDAGQAHGANTAAAVDIW